MKHKNLYKSWVRHLWAQRTGALNFQGAMEVTNKRTTCPLCQKGLTLGITWHALLECEHTQIQQLYKEWATKSDKHWAQLTNQLNKTERDKLLTTHNYMQMRGETQRGTNHGGWIHELGDISPTQYMIISAAHPKTAMDYIFKAQKALTHHNTTILAKYTELAGMYKVVSCKEGVFLDKGKWKGLAKLGSFIITPIL